MLNEEELKLQVDDECTIKQLKNLIYERMDIIGSQQMCIMYAGVKLSDTEKIKNYNIKSGNIIT